MLAGPLRVWGQLQAWAASRVRDVDWTLVIVTALTASASIGGVWIGQRAALVRTEREVAERRLDRNYEELKEALVGLAQAADDVRSGVEGAIGTNGSLPSETTEALRRLTATASTVELLVEEHAWAPMFAYVEMLMMLANMHQRSVSPDQRQAISDIVVARYGANEAEAREGYRAQFVELAREVLARARP